MPDSPLTPDSDPPINQNVKGDRNQTIGQVLSGGMVVYGTVIYNNVPIEPKESDVKPDKKMGPNPYKGLLAFQETDGERFFGRKKQIQELWAKFRSLHDSPSAIRLLPIYGPSGSGKSSLARAGLIPELDRRPLPGREHPKVAVLVPGSHPLEALATVLARIATNDLTPVAKTREFAEELAKKNANGEYDGLRRIADVLPDIAISPLIVLADQLEEVYTLCEDEAERDAFIGNLLCASKDLAKRVSAIVTLRSDFLGATQKYPQLNQLIAEQGSFVSALSVDGLRDAIRKPAEQAGHALDESTVSLLVEQTEGREGALPLLQFALTRIWEGLTNGKKPSQTLTEIGGVGGALAGEAQRIYSDLNPDEQNIARRMFLGLVQLGEGTKDTRRRTALQQMISYRDRPEEVRQVIARFADPSARLITLASDGDASSETVEVTHEALFDNWDQLKKWLDNGRSDLRFQRRLDESAIYWRKNGRPEGNLWRSPDLDLLRQYYDRDGDDMTPLQVELFKASIDLEQAQKQAAEKDEREHRRQQKLWFGFLSTGLVLTLGLLTFASYQGQQTQRQRAEQLATNAEILLSSQPVNAEINAIAATGLSQSAFALFSDQPQFEAVYGSLLDVIRENQEQNQLHHEAEVNSVAFSPNSKHIVSGSRDGTVRIWDAATGEPIGKALIGHTKSVNAVAFSPNGKRIVSGSSDYLRTNKDNTVRIWDAATGQPIGQPLKGHTDVVKSVAYSPDGKRIVSGSEDKTIRVWEAATGKPLGKPIKEDDTVTSVAFSPNGKDIVSGRLGGTVRIWNAATTEAIGKPLPLKGNEYGITSVAFNPDGKRILSVSYDGTVRIGNATTGEAIGKPFILGQPSKIVNPSKYYDVLVTSVAFSPDGKRILSSSRDGTIRIWDAATGQPIGRPFNGHEANVNSVAFSPDGQRIVSGSNDKTVRIWNVATVGAIGKPIKDEDTVTSVAFSPDGQRIVNGSNDKTVRIWNAVTGEAIGKPFKIGQPSKIGKFSKYNNVLVTSVAFSPDGKRILSGSKGGTVRIWDISWKHSLQIACDQLRDNPSLIQPKTDVAKEAKQTCKNYAGK